jgi:hypothetical protein
MTETGRDCDALSGSIAQTAIVLRKDLKATDKAKLLRFSRTRNTRTSVVMCLFHAPVTFTSSFPNNLFPFFLISQTKCESVTSYFSDHDEVSLGQVVSAY